MALQKALDNLHMVISERCPVITHTTLPQVTADPTQLTQVFQNLISNAIKFCQEDSPHIHIGCEFIDDRWVFSVQDNGIGIQPEFAERVFLIFQRLHSRSEYPGTGIGLALCKKIVESHGGRLWVKSGSEPGSTFFFTLPEVR